MSRLATTLRLAAPAFLLIAVQIAAGAEPAKPSAPADTPEVLLRTYLEALDRMDIDDATAIAKRAAEQVPGPITELMIRHTRLLVAAKSEPLSKTRTWQETRADRKNVLYTVTYNVADLMLRPPALNVVTSRTRTAEAMSKQTAAEPDFDSLIDLITAAIKPTTWDTVGGAGSIRPFNANLSIVVTQTQDVHKEITEMLEVLRRMQNETVTIEARLVVLPGEAIPQGTLDTKGAMLDAQQVKRLREAVEKDGGAAALRRVTMMNGQMAAFPAFAEQGETRRVQVQAVLSNDRRHVRLTLIPDATRRVSATVDDGRTLLVDLAPPPDQTRKNDGRQADAKPAAAHRLLLVTPHIIMAEEEEQRLGVLPAAGKR